MELNTVSKRKILETSPDSSLPAGKRSIRDKMALTTADLQEAFAPLLEPLAKSEDVQKLLKQMQDLQMENQALGKKVLELTERCEKLEEQVTSMYNWRNERNVVVHMNKGANAEDEKKRASQLCANLTGEADIITPNDIRAIPIRSGTKSMLIATFSDVNKVYRVLRSSRKLNGTDVSVSKDYSKDTRIKRQYLLKTRRYIINSSGAKLALRDDTLIDGDIKFKWNLSQGLYLASHGNLGDALAKYGVTVEGIGAWLIKPIGGNRGQHQLDRAAGGTNDNNDTQVQGAEATNTIPRNMMLGESNLRNRNQNQNLKN